MGTFLTFLVIAFLVLSFCFGIARLMVEQGKDRLPWLMWYLLALACAIRFIFQIGSVTLFR